MKDDSYKYECKIKIIKQLEYIMGEYFHELKVSKGFDTGTK